MSASPSPLLQVRDLRVEILLPEGSVPAVDGVSFEVRLGETVGLVGETGCGKTLTALAVMRLLPEPAVRTVHGEILYHGENLLAFDARRMRGLRGDRIAMVFQEPMTALNPVLTVGEQVEEVLLTHARESTRRSARTRALDLLARMGIPSPEERRRSYPHQLSGGMRQRVLLAMALACEPDLLLADEPTTALDGTLQAQVMRLIAAERERRGMGVLLITHDLGLVAESCRRVVVLYAGQVVEMGLAPEILAAPRHPYTAGLLGVARSIALGLPRLDRRQPLPEISGSVPGLGHRPSRCHFAERCPRARAECRAAPIALEAVGGEHLVRCIFPLAVDESSRRSLGGVADEEIG